LSGATQAVAQPASGATNWQVACAPDGYCLASVATAARGTFHVARQARCTYWEVSFTTAGPLPDPSRPFTASVDGKTLDFAVPDSVAPFGRPRDFYFLGKPAQALLDLLVPGKNLEIGFTDEAGQQETLEFELAGLARALIAIDEAQHRLGAERVAEAPPYGLFRTDVPGARWMEPALAYYF
jgi:hypothetical protein